MDAALIDRLRASGLLEALPPYSARDVFALTSTLRGAGHDPDLVAAALTQSELRARGRAKFGEAAASMLFTTDGLEQATRPAIAVLHAQRFLAADVPIVYDLGCGIGSDAGAFASSGLSVVAVDADPATSRIAAANLAGTSARAVCARAEEVELPPEAGVWLDPARRTTGVADATGRTKRTFRLDQLMPSWEFVTGLGASGRAVGVKLSPSLDLRQVPDGAEAQWISLDGEVLEAALWFGPLVERAERSAVVLRSGSHSVVRPVDERFEPVASLDDLGAFLYEADRGVVRAGLTDALSAAVEGRELTAGLGHVTADRPVDLPWARSFRIVDAVAYNVKTLRARLRDEHVGVLTVKARGVAIDEPALRRQLKLNGSAAATILVTRVAGDQVVLFLEHTRSDFASPEGSGTRQEAQNPSGDGAPA
ncbi:class I SAM-dependent methyltransferase [Calidifontibacter terrae]